MEVESIDQLPQFLRGMADAVEALLRKGKSEPAKPAVKQVSSKNPTLGGAWTDGQSAKTDSVHEPRVIGQPDLFTEAEFEAGRRAVERKAAEARAKRLKKASVRKRGTPGIGRKQAIRNFREIAAGKELVNLAELNRIFGYSTTTHGRFIKDAIKQGKIAPVQCGERVKFVSVNVRKFIDEYFKTV